MIKKIILILIAITIFSCEKEDLIISDCDCYKLTYVRFNTPTSLGEYYFNGTKEFYSNDCTDDGYRVGGYSGQGVDVEYRIKCE